MALSFSSGLPLGLVWIAIPDWMRSMGVDTASLYAARHGERAAEAGGSGA